MKSRRGEIERNVVEGKNTKKKIINKNTKFSNYDEVKNKIS